MLTGKRKVRLTSDNSRRRPLTFVPKLSHRAAPGKQKWYPIPVFVSLADYEEQRLRAEKAEERLRTCDVALKHIRRRVRPR